MGKLFEDVFDILSDALYGKGAMQITTDGTGTRFPPPANPTEGYSLEELRAGIGGGYIEIVTIEQDLVRMIVDDDGHLKGLPYNQVATTLYMTAKGCPDTIVGPALLVPWEWVK